MRRASPFFQRELVCMHWHRHQDHASCPVCRLLCWAHARISSTSPQSMHGPCGAWHTEIIYHGKRLVGYACRVLRSGSEANLSTVRPRDRCCTHARVKRTSSLRATPSNLKPQRRTRPAAHRPGSDSNVAGSVRSRSRSGAVSAEGSEFLPTRNQNQGWFKDYAHLDVHIHTSCRRRSF